MTSKTRSFLLTLTLLLCVTASAQQPAKKKAAATKPATKASAGWTVKPEWVRADEEFLASDTLQGRGSATHDEELAAQFVASQFESFGLKPAAPGQSFIERAELLKPTLDGKAQVAAGGTTLNEGPDFYLITASSESVSGKLQRIAAADAGKTQIVPGTVVLVTGMADDQRGIMRTTQALRGASAVLLPDSTNLKRLFDQMLGGKTRVPVRVKDSGAGGLGGRGGNTVVLTADALGKITQLPDGTEISLTVHPVPEPPHFTYNAIGKVEGSDPAA